MHETPGYESPAFSGGLLLHSGMRKYRTGSIGTITRRY